MISNYMLSLYISLIITIYHLYHLWYDNVSLPVSANITHSPVPCKTALVRTLSTSRKPIAINTWLLSLPTSVKPITNGRTCTWRITRCRKSAEKQNIQTSSNIKHVLHVSSYCAMLSYGKWPKPSPVPMGEGVKKWLVIKILPPSP